MVKEKHPPLKQEFATLVRILQTDIPGNKRVLAGLTYIKGVSWSISNAVCRLLPLDPTKKISELSAEELKSIANFLENPILPSYLLNRRNDFQTGKNYHLITSELDI